VNTQQPNTPKIIPLEKRTLTSRDIPLLSEWKQLRVSHVIEDLDRLFEKAEFLDRRGPQQPWEESGFGLHYFALCIKQGIRKNAGLFKGSFAEALEAFDGDSTDFCDKREHENRAAFNTHVLLSIKSKLTKGASVPISELQDIMDCILQSGFCSKRDQRDIKDLAIRLRNLSMSPSEKRWTFLAGHDEEGKAVYRVTTTARYEAAQFGVRAKVYELLYPR
jgi:hypothetical protein